jgi:hypothetical protein
MKKQFFLERECIHRETAPEGDFYNGVFVVQAIQNLGSEAAMKFASRMSPFFWTDAPRVHVWLCRECAAELQLSNAPRAVKQSGRLR